MIFADKENLKTSVAQDILRVREKEMKVHTRGKNRCSHAQRLHTTT